MTQHINKLAFAFKCYSLCDLSLMMLKNGLVLRNISISFSPLSPVNGFPRLKIPGITSYGHFEVITWSVNLDISKMAEYKSISTHIYYWPTRRSKTIHPKAFCSSISSTLLSVVSLFWSHNGARNSNWFL